MRAAAALLLATVAGLGAAPGARAQDGGAGAVPLAAQAEGAPISRVDVVLARSGGNPVRENAAVERLRFSLAALEGRSFSRGLIERELALARGRFGTGRIDYRLGPGTTPGTLGLIVEIDAAGPVAGAPPAPTGVFAGDPARFPDLFRSDRAVLTAIVTGGFGAYADQNPWFGRPQGFIGNSPLTGRLPGSAPVWTEGFTEIGLAGATQVGDTPFYAYGVLTGLTSWSLGQDVYRDDARSLTTVEKGYGGVLYVDPGSGNSVNVSIGRQNVTLNDGFLVHFVRGSANIGARGATYLGPRTANDFSVVVDGRVGPFSFKAFHIDPNELPLVDGRTTFTGLNLRYRITPTLSIDGTVITVPKTASNFVLPGGVRVTRESLRTTAGHIRWMNAGGVEGLWVASEIAHQTSDRLPMQAWAGYGLIGYQAARLPWSPSLSYRFSYATGDDPNTGRYERFDPLLSTGLGNWLQGISFGKLTSNSNLSVHRLQLNLVPMPTLNVTFDWHILRAPQLNNLGSNPLIGQLTSHDIGQEFTLSGRWSINRNFYLQTIGSIAVPGQALRNIGVTRNWSSLQASLYWTF